MRRHLVALAVTAGAPIFELAIACEIFGRHRDGLPEPWYDLRMRAHLNEPLTVSTLARHANLTERTLIRQFHAATGTTPVKWLTAQRVQRARELLESTTMPVEQVAEASGLGRPANFRRHFAMAVGVSPSTYRRAFNAGAEPRPGGQAVADHPPVRRACHAVPASVSAASPVTHSSRTAGEASVRSMDSR